MTKLFMKITANVRLFKMMQAAKYKLILSIIILALGNTLNCQTLSGVSGEGFGHSISLSNERTLAIGAPTNDDNGQDAGRVLIYEKNQNGWSRKGGDIQGYAAGDQAGFSVFMPSKNIVAVGSPYNDLNGNNTGRVVIYEWNGTSWLEKGSPIYGSINGGRLGSAISMPYPNMIAIGSPNSSIVNVYKYDGVDWQIYGSTISGSNSFGYSLTMPDSTTIAISDLGGNYQSGNVRIYSLNGNNWNLQQSFSGTDRYENLGQSLDMLGKDNLLIGNGQSYSSSSRINYGSKVQRYAKTSNGSWNEVTNHSAYYNNGYTSIGYAVAFGNRVDNYIYSVPGYNGSYSGSSGGYIRFEGLNSGDLYGGASHMNFGDQVELNSLYDLIVRTNPSYLHGGNPQIKIYNIAEVQGYISTNGCIKCDTIPIGEIGKVNGEPFIVADRPMLDSLIAIGFPMSNVCVSNISDFSNLNFSADFNDNIGNWDVSNATSMSGMFSGAMAFNQDISNWDVSSVTDMSSMFFLAASFNQNINTWEVGNVMNMKNMFYGASDFNYPIHTWDVSQVTDMESMFLFASSFNQPLWQWKVNNVANMDNMFHFASTFNQNLSSWCVNNFLNEPAGFALNSSLMLSNKPTWGTCREANLNSSGCLECDQFVAGEWLAYGGDSVLVVNREILDSLIKLTTYNLQYVCVSKVSNLDSLFIGQTIHGEISEWDVSNVSSMNSTFSNQQNFNQNIGSWDVSNVTDMSKLFTGALSFNQNISNWNVSAVTKMDYTFFFANSFNQDISGWDVSNVTSMNSMFLQAGAFDHDLKPWCMSKIGSEPTGFALNSGLQANNYPRWGVCEAVPGVFISSTGCIECDSLNVGDFFVLDGDSIEVVDRTRLLALVAAQGDLTKVCVSHVQNMKNIFRGAKWFNQDITKWDMSNVTNTVNMFFNAETFNQDLSTWDVSSVTNMTGMFFRADSFNQNLNVWDVSQVTGMSRMFGEAASFNGKIDQWDVSGVNRMTEMFKDATSFNQDLSSWCVSNFEYNAPTNFALNSPLLPAHYPIWGNCPTPYGDNVLALATGAFIDSSGCVDCSALNVGDYFTLGGDTMLVVDRPMLDSLVILRRDLSKVCVSHITDMKDALRGLRWFNTDISGWDVSNVTDMTNMFFKSKIFNQEIGNWNLSSVTNMNRMFQKAESFNGDVSDWDVSNVTKMNATFFGASAFNQDIGDWDVGNVTVAEAMFRNAGAFSQDLSMWCVTNIATQPNLFDWNAALTSSQLPVWGTCPTPPPYQILPNGCISCAALNIGDQFTLNGINYTVVDRPMLDSMITGNHDISKACVSHVTDMFNLFNNRNTSYSITEWDVSNVITMSSMFTNSSFNQNIINWDVSNVTDMSSMFNGSSYVQGIQNWDVSAVTDMSFMFYEAAYFNLDIGQWDVSNVTDMSFMFYQATRFNQDIGSWNVSKVTKLNGTFAEASVFNQDIGSWDVSNVTSMIGTFKQAYSFNQPIGNWDVSNVINMSSMFDYAPAFNQPIGSWDVSSVTAMNNMFDDASTFNQDIGNWDVGSVLNMYFMFYGADNFNKPIGSWDVSNVSDMSYMFSYADNFNQDISSWDVSSVTDMDYMFWTGSNHIHNFLQDLSNWCVTNIPSTPSNFARNSNWWNSLKPQWGTCPVASIAAPDQTDWNTNSTIEGQGNELNLSDGNGISIYPNPTTGIINLEPVPEGTYRLYNEIGRLMDQGKIQPRFDLSNFDNGIYMLLLQTENESKYFKVIKQ